MSVGVEHHQERFSHRLLVRLARPKGLGVCLSCGYFADSKVEMNLLRAILAWPLWSRKALHLLKFQCLPGDFHLGESVLGIVAADLTAGEVSIELR